MKYSFRNNLEAFFLTEKYTVQEFFHYSVYYLIYLEISSNLEIYCVSNPHITLSLKELVK